MTDRICPPLFLLLVVVLGLSACRRSHFLPEEAPLIRFDQSGAVAECDPKAVARVVRSQSTGTGFARLEVQEPADGAVFPPEIAPPVFVWQHKISDIDLWFLEVTLSMGTRRLAALTTTPFWVPEADQWEWIKSLSVESPAVFTVYGLSSERGCQILAKGSRSIRTSKDRLGALVFYQQMPLPFSYAENHPEAFRWRLGDIRSEQPPRTVAARLPCCSNCHSVSSDGALLGMDMDVNNDKGAYVLARIESSMDLQPSDFISWNESIDSEGPQSMGLFSKISPNGRFVASTTQERSFFAYLDDKAFSQFFFPIKGRISIYDRRTERFATLPGADSPRFVQTCPAWSPDGKWLAYARAEPAPSLFEAIGDHKVLPTTPADTIDSLNARHHLRFDLYRIPFNMGQGGQARPIPGASCNGTSSFFPRYSPDGKWIVFTRSRNGLAIQPDSELWILPASGGKARRMTCNRDVMNSWHSWSPNSRWIAFSSKDNSPYTGIYLAHVDKAGRSSPAVFLSRMSSPSMACLVPELVPYSVGRLQHIELAR